MIPVVYSIISILFAVADLFLAGYSLKKTGKTGRYLGFACIGAAVVDISYLVSILNDSYFLVSLMSSIYFVSIDWMLVSLLIFAGYFTRHVMSGPDRIALRVILACAAVDSLILMVNPFHEIAIGYEFRGTVLASYGYRMMLLYDLHLVFTYILILLILILLMLKAIHVPSDYRRLYLYTIYGIVTIVAVNAVFLFLPGESLYNLLDYSICGYSLTAFFLYWNCFAYSSHGMLNHFKNRIFDSIDQGIVLFDYEDYLILHNERASRLLASVFFDKDVTLMDFVKQCGISEQVDTTDDSCVFQCYVNGAEQPEPLRCTYSLLKNSRQEMIGRLFVFSDASLETDVLTGFQNWESFQQFVKENSANFGTSAIVAVCDINGLAELNSSMGHSKGDQALQQLSGRLRMVFPKQSYFVRGQDANLIVVCHHVQEREVLDYLKQVQADYEWSIQFAVSAAKKEDPDILSAIEDAHHAMRNKKLLNRASGHSEMLTSLVRALQECDSDTEAHVQRTQKLGAELGTRLGLTDVQLSSLSLLCLLHDIGKIGIPLEILNKPGKLSDAEWKVLRSHTQKGYQIASSSQELKGIADMILHHHERWDGKGYPDGLSGESIPLLSRVIAVVDAYDAMVNERSYRHKMSLEEAENELRRCTGTQFDPGIVSEFLQLLKEKKSGEPGEYPVQKNSIPVVSRILDMSQMSDPIQKHAVHTIRYSRYFLDEEMRIVAVDDMFEEMTGYTREEISALQMKQMDLIFPEERTEYLCMVNEQLAKGTRAYFEHRLRRKDGSSIYVFCLGRLYFDSAERSERSEIIIADSAGTYAIRSMAEEEAARALSQYKPR